VLPLFKRSEHNEQFQNEFHGQGGPLNVTYPRFDSPLSQMFLDAAAQNGMPLNQAYNDAVQDGSFLYQVTHKNGERCSAAKGFLTPNLGRPNLKVITHAVSAKVELKDRRATGVQFYQGNQMHDRACPARGHRFLRGFWITAVAATLGHWCIRRVAKGRCLTAA
jgi:choline dehydrogenase-like flavoprotein